jgi:hypothetical protein
MSCILYHTDAEASGKISIDGLFDRNRERDIKQLSIFNKILNRVHTRITVTSKHKRDKYIWFVIPEYILGESNYSNPDCIAFIITKLSTNGFMVKYLHPNTIFVSWEGYVPAYVRSEFKKKTGRIVNEKGVIEEIIEDDPDETDKDTGDKSLSEKVTMNTHKNSRNYTPIKQYRPSGNLVYNEDIFNKIEKKMSS